MSGALPGRPVPPSTLRRRRFMFAWLIPLLATIIAAYLAYQTFSEQGPLLTVTFNSGNGLRAGQTELKYKSVPLGIVNSIDLSKDHSHVIVRIRMNKVGTGFLTDRARFWIQGANFSPTDPSSLTSFVSGASIAVDPGLPGGRYCDHFVGLEQPPGVRSDDPGRTYQLFADQVGPLRTGSPVFFRDVNAGEVLSYDLGNGIGPVKITIFVRAPFDNLIRSKTHFWNDSGIDLIVQPGAFHFEFESLQAMLSGGVAFNLPSQVADDQPSPGGASFHLYASKNEADSAGFEKLISAVTYFHSSVAGLSVGSPVDIYGIQIGVVTDIRLLLDSKSGDEKVRVAMSLQPQRNAHEADFATSRDVARLLQTIVNSGMRIELASANLITGQKLIAFTIVKGVKPMLVTREGDAYVLPSRTSAIDQTLANISDISAKLDKIPIEKIGVNLDELLQSTNYAVGGKPTKEAIGALAPTLNSLNRTLKMLNEQYGSESDFKTDIINLLGQGDETLRSIKQLSDYLARHPNSLIFGR